MYSVEMDYDGTEITTLCEKGEYEDIQLILDNEGGCVLRQYREDTNSHDVITLSWQQLTDLLAAINSPTGLFYKELN